MSSKVSGIVVLAVALWSCGGGDAGGEASDQAMPGSEEASEAASVASADQQGEYTRDSFVLCPALEGHREELASIVGFEQDPERGLSGAGSECIVRGEDGNFARVTLLPAFTRSIAMHAQSFDAEASPAPELGAAALFIDGVLQPHVVFSMGELFIDVDAENIEKPSRETMIELATRVREILREANS